MSEPTEEQLIEQVINEITDKFTRDYKRAVAPYIDRLAQIRAMQPVKFKITPELLKLISNEDIDKII